MRIARGGGGSVIPFHRAIVCGLILFAALTSIVSIAVASERTFTLSAPSELTKSGLLRFFLPRFSLKHATRVELVDDPAKAVARLSREEKGDLVFSGPKGDWYLETTDGEGADAAKRFANWVVSPVGQNTIASFELNGVQPFIAAANTKKEAAKLTYDGDVHLGESLAERHCGRCHMVNEKTRMTTIGSTPSFALLRGFTDWSDRFEAFYALRPHPAFTIVEEVTEPFDDRRPPPIAPMRVTVEDIEAIMAFVSTIKPADLGSPIKAQ